MPINPLAPALLPLLAVLPLNLGQDASQRASDVEVVAIRTDDNDRMTVPVRIGDNGPFRFLIDTGAQNTVLSSALAQRLSLTPSARAKLIGVAGSRMVDTVEIDELGLGKRSYYGLLAPLLDANNIGADGILGLDSLQGQRVLVDFRKNLMAIDDAKSLGGNKGFEIVVTARRRFGQLIMADATIDGVRTDVVIDTGGENSIGNLALQDALARRKANNTTTLHSVTGDTIEATIGYGRSLKLDDFTIRNVMIAYADAPAFKALDLHRRPALFLGMREMRTFDRVAIDFSTRKVLFDLPSTAF